MKYVLISALISLSVAASTEVSKFRGQTYTKANYDGCMKDIDAVAKEISAVEGYKVLDSGCAQDVFGNYRMEINYLSPLAEHVEGFSNKYANETVCLNAKVSAKAELLATGNHFITSYCNGSELTTHFIDTTRSMVRSLNRIGKFKTQADCQNMITDLTARTKKMGITSFMSDCQEAKYDYSGKTFFNPVFNYIAYFDTEIKVINGKVSNACLTNRNEIEATFAVNKIQFVSAYCPEAMSYDNTLQETIMYLRPNNLHKYTFDFNGVISADQAACETQMNIAVTELNHAGKNVLYGHCMKLSNNTFRPTITYLESIQQ